MHDQSDTFQDLPLKIPDELITEIFHQAWTEALSEARQLLKQKMLLTILNRALASSPSFFSPVQEETKHPVGCAETSPASPLSRPAPDDRTLSEDAKRIQEEIEGIRQKLSKNEKILQQIKTPPAPSSNPEPAARDESTVVAVDGKGYYVYCVEGNDSSRQWLAQDSPTDVSKPQGIDPTYPLYTIADKMLQAVVSQVPLQEFGEAELDRNLHDSAWLESRVRRHQDTLETLSSTNNLVPMRFCTIYLSEARVQEMLARYHADFTKALEFLARKQEWGVKAYCDKDLLAHHIEETDESILSLKAEQSGKSSGLAYFTRKKLAETIVEQVERTSDAYAQDGHNRLTACAVASSLLQVQTKEASGRQEEMVSNGAYLIDKEKITTFRTELEKLGNEYSLHGFSYDFTGPWPPYNFVNIGGEERQDG